MNGCWIDDVRPYIANAAVFIAPLRAGSGTKIKVLNAMAQSKAVVTTSVGAEGIDATRGEEIVVADAPAEFADETVFLLQNPDLVQSIGAKARQLIEEKYDWRIIERDIHELYKKLSPNYLQFAFL